MMVSGPKVIEWSFVFEEKQLTIELQRFFRHCTSRFFTSMNDFGNEVACNSRVSIALGGKNVCR